MVAEFNKQQQRSFGPATLVDSLQARERAVPDGAASSSDEHGEEPEAVACSARKREDAVQRGAAARRRGVSVAPCVAVSVALCVAGGQ